MLNCSLPRGDGSPVAALSDSRARRACELRALLWVVWCHDAGVAFAAWRNGLGVRHDAINHMI